MFTILANLGRDAELRYTQNQTPVASLALAYSYGIKDQATGNRPTQWIEASLWGKQAEALAQYLTKGTKLMVSLKDVHIESYPKKDGTQGTKLVATAADIHFAGGQQQSQGQQQPQAYQGQQQPPQGYQQGYQTGVNQAAGAAMQSNQPDNDIPFNDNVPF